jgi:hypothetical protein
MYFDLNYIIEQVGKEKGIPKETLIEALEEAILLASKKKFGNHLDLEARYNEESTTQRYTTPNVLRETASALKWIQALWAESLHRQPNRSLSRKCGMLKVM